MKAKRYDEFQVANRHKIAFQTLIMLMIIILINGYFKEGYGIWARPMLEMYVLIFIPTLYFILSSIVKNAYLSRNDHPILFILLSGFAFILTVFTNVPSLLNGTFNFVSDGQLSDSVGNLLLMIMTGSITIALLIKMKLNKRIAMSDD